MRDVTLAVCVALLSSALGCASDPPPAMVPGVIVPPDATFEVVSEALEDAVALADLAGGAGVLPITPGRLSRSGLEAAGVLPPIAVSARSSGGILVSARVDDVTRLQLALSQVLPEAGLRRRRLLGQVDAVIDADDVTRALIRAGNGSALVVIGPEDALAEAALLEGLATGAVEAPRRDPRGLVFRLVPRGPIASVLTAPVEGTLERRPGGLVARARFGEEATSPELRQALSSSPTASSCAADDGAMAVLHLPAVAGLSDVVAADDTETMAALGLPAGLDAFEGRLTIALLPPPAGTTSSPADLPSIASLAVIGRPRRAAVEGLKASIDEALAGVVVERKTVGTREVRTIGPAAVPWRRLAVVVDGDVFAAGLGATVVVDRVAAGVQCPPGARLLTLHGPAVVGLVERAAPELRLVRRLASVTGATDPLAVLAAIADLTIDAAPASDPAGAGSITVDVGLTLTRASR